jgi:tetratricopeptide (TPR) repeat protein
MSATSSKKSVHAWRERITIPTYEVGEPELNPCFLEKRVYQGSSGAVYPFPVIESVANEKSPRDYDAIFLENEYLKIMILPELGGRVQMALDKTNDYHFVYYNRVIKPALVGLAGPWISGGIEFNWPQHHRPSTFHPVDVDIVNNGDGSHTVWCNEIDRMVGTRGMHGFTLHPGKAYLEIRVRLSNRTPLPQTFLWWANPAVHVDENHQSIFPPDVTAVMDHGKRDVSSFPIATGEYYKVNYAPGTDISRYKNIPVPTSYMAYHSDYNFVGSYDHGRQAGLLHVASHHVSPGKKQWTWGCSDFGKAWDRQLTDEDGPYVELMCGVYTDNQPDFSWLSPGEQKAFTQYFMPYKGVGVIKNATIDAVVGLESTGNRAVVKVYITAEQPEARVEVKHEGQTFFTATWNANPLLCHEYSFELPTGSESSKLTVAVYDQTGKELVSYSPKRINTDIPEPARAIAEPNKIESNELLYLAGLHLEQYRHATRRAEDYYREALSRDPSDLRCNLALGRSVYRRGLFRDAELCFRAAIKRATRHNPNPIDGECYYLLGLALAAQEKFADAENALHKATWNSAYQENAWFELARISLRGNRYVEAKDFLEKCLAKNAWNHQAAHLLVVTLVKLDRHDEARSVVNCELTSDPFNKGVLFETAFALQGSWETYDFRSRDDSHTVLELANDYAAAGLYERAIAVIEHYLERMAGQSDSPLVFYYLADFQERQGDATLALSLTYQAASIQRTGFFPNRMQDLLVLESAVERYPGDYRALCDIGNLLYSKRRYDEAIRCWEDSRNLASDFAQPLRNLGLAYFNQRHDHEAAWKSFKEAQRINPDDARVLFELDQLAKRLNHNTETRLARLQNHRECVEKRDDLTIELVTLLNQQGRHDEALTVLLERQFHPWEGGEGKASSQYKLSLVQLARLAIEEGHAERAIELLNRAMSWPDSLGEGKLYGIQENNIHYWLGVACQQLGDSAEAIAWFEKASHGLAEPTSAQFYNDQPPEMIFYQGLALQALDCKDEANKRFEKLIEFGERHLNDDVAIDFFAVSLPDFLVFEGDLAVKNELHCRFMQALGYLGLGQDARADEQFERILELDANHLGALTHQQFNSLSAKSN